jgi:hypothetical protein
MNIIKQAIDLCNRARREMLSEKAIYRTVTGTEYEVLITPWHDGFQSFQPIWYENVSLSQQRAAFIVLKDQLVFDGVFYEPKQKDRIVQEDGSEYEVYAKNDEPQWFYAQDNPMKNTIVINTIRRK